MPARGALIKRDWVKRYQSPPPDAEMTIVQSWDTGLQAGETNDWSVGTTWLYAPGRYYLLDVQRVRAEFPVLERLVKETAERFRAQSILIEKTALGAALEQAMRYHSIPVIGVNAEGDKVSRMAVQAAKFEAGQVLFPDPSPVALRTRARALRVSAEST